MLDSADGLEEAPGDDSGDNILERFEAEGIDDITGSV